MSQAALWRLGWSDYRFGRHEKAAARFESLAKATSYIILIVFSLCHAALVLIKLRQPQPPSGVFTNPLWVPVIGCMASLGLLLYPIFVG